MASAPSDLPPASGRVDRDGRLVSADPPLAALQIAAGSALGKALALPQLAALVRSAQSLQVPISRVVFAADEEHDLDLWVRAEPDAEGVTLVIERGARRPPAPARLELISRLDTASDEVEAEVAPAEPLEWAVDGELRVTELSPALLALLARTAQEVIGQPLTRLFRLVEEQDGHMPLLRALAGREDFTGQQAESRGEGGPVRLSGHATFDGDGRFSGFRGEAEGKTGATAPATDDAALLDHALDAALRSPLDRIIDAADRIVERSDGPLRSDYANYASDIAAAGRHLLSVIRSMSEDVTNGKGEADIAAAVDEAAGLVQAAADRGKVALSIDRGALLAVRGEQRAIVQILVNIIGNAIRHSPEGGTVAVSFLRSNGTVAVTVADEGTGIAADDQQRIFERYEQADSRRRRGEGTGLGLAISRRLARSMGGDIVLDSATGEGARFTLRLPAA